MINLKNIFNCKLLWGGLLVYLLTVIAVTNTVGDTYAATSYTGCSNIGSDWVARGSNGYCCPSGFSLSGSTCYRTTNSSATCNAYINAYRYTYIETSNQCQGMAKRGMTCYYTQKDCMDITGYPCASSASSNACYQPTVQSPSQLQFTATFYFNGGSMGSAGNQITTSCDKSSFSTYCTVNVPTGVTKPGFTFAGWKSNKNGEVVFSYDELYSNESYTAQWNEIPTGDDRGNTTGGTTTPGGTEEGKEIVFVTKPNYITWHTVTYDLNGGKYIDGKTTRTQHVRSDRIVGAPKTYPIKQGYKFIEWQLDGAAFDFSTKLTKNVTLKAVYEEFDGYDKYTCESGYDIFDPYTQSCYKVLTPDNTNTFNYTRNEYATKSRVCYAHYEESDSNDSIMYVLEGSTKPYSPYSGDGVIAFVNDIDSLVTTTGKNNADYSDLGYDKQEYWTAENTCAIGTGCNSDKVNNEECVYEYDAIVYGQIPANYIEPEEEPIPEEPETGDDTSTDDKDNSNDKQNEEVKTNVKTGDILISGVVIMLFASLFVLVYYMNKKKQENN